MTENPQKEEKKADTWVPEVVNCSEFLAGQEDGLVWLGHATFVLRTENTTLLFDPLLFDSAFLKRRHPLPCRPEELTNIDLLLLSHGHRDHLDEASIKLVAKQNPEVQVLTSLRMAPLLRGMASSLRVQEAGWWQQYSIDWESMGLEDPASPPLEIYYLPAAHWHRRGLTDLNKVLWGSFLIRTQDKLIYFGGDSAYAGHFEDIERQFGPIDICMLGIGAYKPAFMMQLSHTNPHEAAKAANVLRAGHMVPMHHGTFDLSDEPASEPIRILQDVAHGNMLRGELHVPKVGEVLPWTQWE
ncbi:MBL fold metallo-hydrolase [Hymenobacter cellulosilyticus]|uniref:MBL fold metallo-hydrolase n=1 Tax=Hymenobacter cellulosilyticus TaxID=2932248 RepID=A0A8T9QBQ1_9BACT|nr:MBL fold metallo-hydrolase [Hymenobacter cellulosilyticus]UOQ74615.1 MBL fold metallo-hydrolase [Hymenobacter cellulosilyticus]